MTNHPRRRVLGMALGAAAIAGLPAIELPVAAAAAEKQTIPDPLPVSIATFFDNDGIDTADAHDGNFDGSGYAFPGEQLTSGRVVADGVPYDFPTFGPGQKNNIVALGQQIPLPRGHYVSAEFLVSCSYGSAGGPATVHYADGTTSQAQLGGADWYSGSGAISSMTTRRRRCSSWCTRTTRTSSGATSVAPTTATTCSPNISTRPRRTSRK